MRGEFLDLDDCRLYYYAAGTRGAGEPVVFLHGFPTSSHLWLDLVPHMPAGHRLVVVDLLGFGRSDPPQGHDVTLKGHASRVISLLDTLGINFACIVGHDIGGGIAQVMAVQHPARVSRICLIDSVCFDGWPARAVKLARAMIPLTRHLPPTWLHSIVHADLLRGYAAPDRAARAVDRYLRPFATPEGRDALMAHLGALDAAETAALAPRLRDMVQPTSVLWGAADPFLPVTLGQRLAGTIPSATLEVVPDAGHFLPEEAPERVARSITALLAR